MNNYYDNNAEAFISSTISLDLSGIYSRFLQFVPNNGHILDAGCGSSRDSKYFLSQGFQVSAFDSSKKMVEAARTVAGLSVRQQSFEQVSEHLIYDGVWPCASLLHLSTLSLKGALTNLCRATKSGGSIYVSFKLGTNEEIREGRYYTDQTSESLEQIVKCCPELVIMDQWVSEDIRTENITSWLNTIFKKAIAVDYETRRQV